jgi:hypothetical protein
MPPSCDRFSQPGFGTANSKPGLNTSVWYLPGESSPRHVCPGSQAPSVGRSVGRGMANGNGGAVGPAVIATEEGEAEAADGVSRPATGAVGVAPPDA